MQIEWTSHIKEQAEKNIFKERVKASREVLSRLNNILDERIKAVLNTSETDYKDAAWAYLQADRNGYMRAIKELQKFLIDNV